MSVLYPAGKFEVGPKFVTQEDYITRMMVVGSLARSNDTPTTCRYLSYKVSVLAGVAVTSLAATGLAAITDGPWTDPRPMRG